MWREADSWHQGGCDISLTGVVLTLLECFKKTEMLLATAQIVQTYFVRDQILLGG